MECNVVDDVEIDMKSENNVIIASLKSESTC